MLLPYFESNFSAGSEPNNVLKLEEEPLLKIEEVENEFPNYLFLKENVQEKVNEKV